MFEVDGAPDCGRLQQIEVQGSRGIMRDLKLCCLLAASLSQCCQQPLPRHASLVIPAGQVRHDGAGRSNGWHLAWVKATNLTTGAVAMFKCGRW